MADRSRRAHARHPCDLPAGLFTGPTGGVRLSGARIMDLSLTGCLFAASEALSLGSTYRLVVEARGGPLELPGRVARDAGRSGKDPRTRYYGFVFNLTAGQERALRVLLDELRRAPEDPGEDRLGRSLRDYWSS
jgi:hypothetical protein